MEGSRIDLKKFLGLAKPNQCSQLKVSKSKYQAGFGVIISGQNPQTFLIPIYSTTVLYMQVEATMRFNFKNAWRVHEC